MKTQSKHISKICAVIVSVLFLMFPVLLSGCSPTPPSNYSGGSQGGGSTDSASTKQKQYFDSFLATYKAEPNQVVLQNAFEQISLALVADSFLVSGLQIDAVPVGATAQAHLVAEDGTATTFDYALTDLLGESIEPTIKVSTSNDDTDTTFCDLQNWKDSFKLTFSQSQISAMQQADTAYQNACDNINKSDDSDQDKQTALDQALDAKNKAYQQVFVDAMQDYVSNQKIRQKFALALAMIASNKDLSNFDALSMQIDNISSQDFVLQTYNNILAAYLSQISQIEFSTEQQSQLTSFVLQNVIGANSASPNYAEYTTFAQTVSTYVATTLQKNTGFATYSVGNVTADDESLSGYKSYQSLLFAPKKDVEIRNLSLSVWTDQDLELSVYVRYYDATRGYAKFAGTDYQFVDKISITIDAQTAGQKGSNLSNNDDSESGDAYVDETKDFNLSSILSGATFDDGTQPDGILPAFSTSLPFSNGTQGTAIGDFGNGKYFDTYSLNGKNISVYSQKTMSQASSYVEFLFSAKNPTDRFLVSLYLEDEDFS